jgi:hypothetical protein
VQSNNQPWDSIGECSVAWSGIGKFNFNPGDEKTAGFTVMPWDDWGKGNVSKVARLKDVVAVYGSGGRAFLVPYTSKTAVGFGLKELTGPGISKGSHFAGDYSIHGFISTDNEFWVVDEGLSFKKLGYKEYIDDMIAENAEEGDNVPVIVSFEPLKKRFYISGFSSSYVLTEFGLYSTHQSVTGIGNYRGGVLGGFVKDHEDYEGRLTVSEKDFKLRGMKTIDALEYGVDNSSPNSLFAGVDFKYDYDEDYRSSNWIRLSPQGVASPIITANDLRVKFKVEDYRVGNLKLDYINVRYKVVDKRAIRGLYNIGSNPSRRNQRGLGNI